MLQPSKKPEIHSGVSLLARLFCSPHILVYLIVPLMLVIAVRSVVFAQEVQPPDEEEVIRVNTDLLLFPVRIRDKRGQFETKLTEQDLSLSDKDHVTTGLYFYPGADRVALLFALDQSGSLREIVSQQRDAALALFSRFSERSRVSVIRFSESPSLVAPFGRDEKALREAFNFPAEANRHTAIFNAAAAALSAFDSLARVRAERRIVILISDGLDNVSTIKPGTIIESALQKRVSFYVIHLPLFEPRDGRLAVRSPAKGFRDLAEKTGGKYFLVGDTKSALLPQRNLDLSPVFQAIEDDLKSQYLLGFYLGDKANDGHKHRFSLSVPSGYEYQVGLMGYSRTQDFFVLRPREALKRRN
jgi:Ca-activated chloride channel family protein